MQFPVQTGNDQAVAEALNYLLSGPGGLGQNFAGFSAYVPGWLTGNFRTPYSQSVATPLYVAPINLGTSEMLDERTFKFTFSGYGGANPPFIPGNNITVSGVANDWYNGSYTPIGVVACTTTYAIVRLQVGYPVQPSSTGGTILLSATSQVGKDTFFNSTDCNAKVTVTGGTDRVFVSAQLNNIISYNVTSTATLVYTAAVNRYKGFINDDPVNPEYRFGFDQTVSQKTYTYPGLTGTNQMLADVESVFTTVIDQPPPAFYWYILETSYAVTSGAMQVTYSELDLRSLSAQVVKA
jgi:hypothetical protein